MPSFRPGELSQWVSRLWKNGVPAGPVTGVSTDTRTLEPGNLYVALRGPNFDGHGFVGEAQAKGAAGALVREGFEWREGLPLLKVPDTLKGLQDLARGYRKTWAGTVVGVTGSVGKTTVKEMCADILSMAGLAHRTAGNLNNHIGLPLSMLAMPPEARYGIFEIGMSRPGEIAALADLLRPRIGILTDICNAHRENFRSLEEIAMEKAKLAGRVDAAGFVVVDRDCPWHALVRRLAKASVATVSLEGVADYVGRRAGPQVLNVNGHDYAMPQPGEHTMRNALRAIAVGLELRMDPGRIAEGLRRFAPPPMRWQEVELAGVRFTNDAYNANPLSMRASLQTFAQLGGPGKKWAVLGGMRELGSAAAEEHGALGEFLEHLPLDGVVLVGELAGTIGGGDRARAFRCRDAAEAARILKELAGAGDRVLLKASRGEKLERVLDHFKEA